MPLAQAYRHADTQRSLSDHRCEFLSRKISILLLLALIAFIASPMASAQPHFYETTLLLQQPVLNVSSVQRVVYRWSSPFTSGLITEDDLEDLTLILVDGTGQLVYVDSMIVNGQIQPFDGMPRVLGGGLGIYWQLDLDFGILEEMSNVNEDTILLSSGRHFDVHDSISIPEDGRVSIKFYLDGVNQDPFTDQLDSQSTVPILFFDDFESGDLSSWSGTIP